MTSLLRIGLVALALGLGTPAAQAGGPFSIFSDGLFLDAPARVCLVGNSALRRAIERQGYSKIYLNVPNDNRIQVRATRGDWVYLLQVNHCTGRVLERRRLRPA